MGDFFFFNYYLAGLDELCSEDDLVIADIYNCHWEAKLQKEQMVVIYFLYGGVTLQSSQLTFNFPSSV